MKEKKFHHITLADSGMAPDESLAGADHPEGCWERSRDRGQFRSGVLVRHVDCRTNC